MSLPLRDLSVTRAALAKARQRSPSSLRSNIQPGSENRWSVSVASIGLVQSGTAAGRSLAPADTGRTANGSEDTEPGSAALTTHGPPAVNDPFCPASPRRAPLTAARVQPQGA